MIFPFSPGTNVTAQISLSFGGSFVEITALTTLIGSAAAESLILGNHGAAGVAWATMSAFGLLWVIRACIAAVCPGWLRETIGVRTLDSDLALGMELASGSNAWGAAKIRKKYVVNGLLGIVVEQSEALQQVGSGGKSSKYIRPWREVYAFNNFMSRLLSGIPDYGADSLSVATYADYAQFGRGFNDDDPSTGAIALAPTESELSSLFVYSYAQYTFYRQHNPRFQICVLGLSVFKLGECFTILAKGGRLLAVVTAIPWAYFFVVSICLQAIELFLVRKPEQVDGHLDILAGFLVTVARPGGTRKIILGAPRDPRTLVWWRLMWAAGAIVCTPTLAVIYMLMGRQTNEVIFVWVGFQIIWTLARLVVHHFAESTDTIARRMLVARPWDKLPMSMKKRVVELMVAFARFYHS